NHSRLRQCRKSGTFWKLSPMLCSLMNRGLSLSISASMKHFQRVGIPFLLIFIAAATLAAGQDSGKQAPSFVLPAQFGGWQLEGTVRTTKDPSIADPVSAPVLNEYGFGDFESATYTREEHRQVRREAPCNGQTSISTTFPVGRL